MKIAQEEDQVPERRIVMVAVGTILVTALAVATAWWLTDCRAAELGSPPGPGRASVAADRASTPAPEQVNNLELIPFARPSISEALEATKRERLGHYGWVDTQGDIIHMPINRAMELYLRQGGLAPALRPPKQPANQPLPEAPRLFPEPPTPRMERWGMP